MTDRSGNKAAPASGIVARIPTWKELRWSYHFGVLLLLVVFLARLRILGRLISFSGEGKLENRNVPERKATTFLTAFDPYKPRLSAAVSHLETNASLERVL